MPSHPDDAPKANAGTNASARPARPFAFAFDVPTHRELGPDNANANPEARRAWAIFLALKVADNATGAEALLRWLEPSDSPSLSTTVTVTPAICAALANQLRTHGHPLTDEGIARFRMQRGFADAVRITPAVAAAYARFAAGVECRLQLTNEQWESLPPQAQGALRLLLIIGQRPTQLAALQRRLGIRPAPHAPDKTILLGAATAQRLVRWGDALDIDFSTAGLAHLAQLRRQLQTWPPASADTAGSDGSEDSDSGNGDKDTPSPAALAGLDSDTAAFIIDAVLERHEPRHDYTQVPYQQHILNRRTASMLHQASVLLGHSTPWVVRKGSYRRSKRQGAHPHMGGGVVDVFLPTPKADPNPAIKALRQAGFAAWLRERDEGQRHIHCVAIGDRELSPAAQWQVRAFFAQENGRTRRGPDPHRELQVALPTWVAKYAAGVWAKRPG